MIGCKLQQVNSVNHWSKKALLGLRATRPNDVLQSLDAGTL